MRRAPDELEELKVFTLGDEQVIHVPAGRGEELKLHLWSHGIRARVSPAAETPYERLEIEGNTDAETLQTIVDHWER